MKRETPRLLSIHGGFLSEMRQNSPPARGTNLGASCIAPRLPRIPLTPLLLTDCNPHLTRQRSGFYTGGMRVCGQEIGLDVIDRIKATLKADPQISRRRLFRKVCEWLDWRGPSGKLQDRSCRKPLSELDRREIVRLPEIDPVVGFETNPGTTSHELPAIALRERARVRGIPAERWILASLGVLRQSL